MDAPAPRAMSPVMRRAPVRPPVPKKMVPNKIKLGNRPLQGRKALVSTARSRSRGESMIRHPVTPAALQPRPMHMVRACLPQAPHRANPRSRRKATRGKYPTSSRRVKSGKKMAIGGSITATTRATVV